MVVVVGGEQEVGRPKVQVVVVVVVGGEQEVGQPKVQVGGTSLRASKRRGLPERYLRCSRPSNRRVKR